MGNTQIKGQRPILGSASPRRSYMQLVYIMPACDAAASPLQQYLPAGVTTSAAHLGDMQLPRVLAASERVSHRLCKRVATNMRSSQTRLGHTWKGMTSRLQSSRSEHALQPNQAWAHLEGDDVQVAVLQVQHREAGGAPGAAVERAGVPRVHVVQVRVAHPQPKHAHTTDITLLISSRVLSCISLYGLPTPLHTHGCMQQAAPRSEQRPCEHPCNDTHMQASTSIYTGCVPKLH